MRVAALLALVLLASGLTAAGSRSPGAAAKTDGAALRAPAAMDRFLRAMTERREFSGVALVARRNRIVFARGYGYADRRLRRPNLVSTQFRITGLTTLFTRAAVYQLRDRGRLELGSSVCRRVPRCPRAWQAVTVAMLLDGAASFPDVRRFRTTRTTPPSIGQTVDWMRQHAGRSVSRAGDRSAAATILLAYVVERTSGLRWDRYLARNVFRPAGMTSTDPDERARASRAVGYLLPAFARGRDFQFSSPDPAQGLWSTAVDLFRFNRALEGGRLLSPASVSALLGARTHRQIGFHAYDTRPGQVSDGFYTLIGRHTSDGLFVALVMNGRKAQYRFYEIATALARLAAPPLGRGAVIRLPPGDLLAFGGPDNGALAIASPAGSPRFRLTSPYSGQVHRPSWSPSGTRLAFSRCQGDSCNAFVINANGRGLRRVRSGIALGWTADGGALLMHPRFQAALVAVPLGRGAVRTLTTGVANDAALSPDGRRLAYTTALYGAERGRSRQRNWLVVRDLSARGQARVSGEPGFYQLSAGAWSPDGARLAFTRRPSLGAFSAGVFLATLDGAAASVERVASGGNNGASWSPDGRRLAYNLGISCEASILDLDGGTATRLPFEACTPVWRPGRSGAGDS